MVIGLPNQSKLPRTKVRYFKVRKSISMKIGNLGIGILPDQPETVIVTRDARNPVEANRPSGSVDALGVNLLYHLPAFIWVKLAFAEHNNRMSHDSVVERPRAPDTR